MITKNFLNLAMSTVLSGDMDFYLANNDTSVISSLGCRSISFTTSSGDDYVMVKTSGTAYFDEGTTETTVSCINSCAAKDTTPYYSLPLQGTTTISSGLMLKVNPYKENGDGEHIRGIMVKFSIPETT